MLSDIISTNDYNSYNVKLAESLGLMTAIYVGEILRQYNIAKMNDAVKYGTFEINRNDCRRRTSLTAEEQKEIEFKLSDALFISKQTEASPDIKINFEKLYSVLSSDDKDVFKDLSKYATKTKKDLKEEEATSRIGKKVDYYMSLITEENEELLGAYRKWITKILSSTSNKKYMNDGVVIEAQSKINEAATTNKSGEQKKLLDVALDIIKVATDFEYANMDWAIKKYKEKNSNFSSFAFNQGYKKADTNQPWLDGSSIRVN